jgi:hypothetical protein
MASSMVRKLGLLSKPLDHIGAVRQQALLKDQLQGQISAERFECSLVFSYLLSSSMTRSSVVTTWHHTQGRLASSRKSLEAVDTNQYINGL